MPQAIQLKLVVDKDSLNIDVQDALNAMDSSFQYAANKLSAKFDQIGQNFGKSMLESVRQMDSSLQYAAQRWTVMFQELGAQIGLALNVENILARLGNGINALKAGGAAAGGNGPKGISDVEQYVGHLTNVLESRLIGPNGLVSRVERMSGYNPDTGGLTRASVTYRGDEATRIRMSETSPYVDPKVARAESILDRAMMWAERFASAGRVAAVENIGVGGVALPPFVSRSPGFTSDDLLSLRLRGARIDSDVAFGGITSDSSAALRAQQALYDQVMASVGQEKLGMLLRGARVDSDVANEFAGTGARVSPYASAQQALYAQVMAQAAQDRLGVQLRGVRTDADVAYEAARRQDVLRQQEVLYGNLQSGAFLESGGFRRTSTSIGPNGEPVSESYSRGAGFFTNAESATRNLATGQLHRQIQENTSMAHKMWAAIAGEGSSASQAINAALSPLRALHSVGGQIVNVFHTIGNEAIRISALIYSFRRIGRGVTDAFLGPIEYVMNATEKGREFEGSIAGLAGVGGARSIDRQLVAGLQNTPFSLDETRQQFMEFAKVSPFARAIAHGGGMSQFADFQGILAGLQTLNPGADSATITQGITGALLGQGRSLRGVVRIDPDQLAELVGHSSQRDFRNNPELLFQALQRYIQAFAAPGAIAARQNLPGVQMSHIQSTFEDAMSRIGDSGIFDAVVKELKKVADGMFQYVQSPEFQARAEAISGFLTTILHNVGDAIMSFANGFTGQMNVKKNADGVTESVQNIVAVLADASYQLPSAAELAGQALRFLVSSIAEFADFVIRMADKLTMNHPMSEQGRATQLSHRLDEIGFGPSEQSVQKYQDFVGWKYGAIPQFGDRFHVVPAGPRAQLIQKIIDASGSYSDTAVGNKEFFTAMIRGIYTPPGSDATLPRGSASGPTTRPSDLAAASALDSTDRQTAAQLLFRDAASVKDPQLQSILMQNALPSLFDLGRGDQFDALDRVTKSRLAAIQAMGKYGPAYDSIVGGMAGNRSVGGARVDALQEQLMYAQGIFADRQTRLQASPNDQSAKDEYAAAANNVTLLTAELQKAQQQASLLTTTFVQFGNQTQNILEQGLGKALTDIELKTGNVRAAFAAMGRDILNQFNELMMHNLFGTIFGTPNGNVGAGNGIGGGVASGTGLLGGLLNNWFASMAAGGQVSAGYDAINSSMAGFGMFAPAYASGGIVKGGPGQLAVIGEGGLGADEAIVPMRNGFLPIGHDEGGMHAVLPGGRRIPAALFANGGITGGGNVATMGAASSFTAVAASGWGHGGSGGGDVHHTTNVVLDGKVIASHTAKLTQPMVDARITRAMRPGGDGRRAMGRV